MTSLDARFKPDPSRAIDSVSDMSNENQNVKPSGKFASLGVSIAVSLRRGSQRPSDQQSASCVKII
jgi:hypothetical protein